MAEIVLTIEHLTRRYGDRIAVQDLNLCVRAGQTVGFLGPNGAGKTTTIRILLGLIRPDSGRALIAGADTWRDHVRAARHYGAVLETTAFYPFLTGREPRWPRCSKGSISRTAPTTRSQNIRTGCGRDWRSPRHCSAGPAC